MQELFTISDFNFEIDAAQSGLGFDYSGALAVTIAAKANDAGAALKAGLLDDYEPVGDVEIRFTVLGVYRRDGLSGVFHFTEDRHQDPYLSLYKKGFQYNLHYYGDIIFEEGTVLLQGYLKPSWADRPAFQVNIRMQTDTRQLDWKNYCFTTVEEALDAPVEDVRRMFLVNPEFTLLPKGFYRLTALRRLEIIAKWPVEKIPLERVDDKLLDLSGLEHLVIVNSKLVRIPEYMNKLQHLRHCSLAGGELSRIPAHLMDMPALEYLNLNGNQLSEIPVFDLPNLKYLHLANNQLKTLPENLPELPKLEELNVSNNPFSFLPHVYSDFKGLKLDMESRQSLLDNTYRNADGEAPTPWDDTIYFAQHDDALIRPVDAIIATKGLEDYQAPLRSLVKKAIGFKMTGEADYSAVGGHRFGGMPDLPPDIDYPAYYDDYTKKHYKYEFIAQVNCETLAALQEYLPRTGTLFFFFETIHRFGGRDHHSPCKVLYVADNATLQSGKRFSFNEEDFFELPGGQYAPYTASAVVKNAAPSFYAWRNNRHLFRGDAQALLKETALLETLYDVFEDPVNSLQPGDHEINAHGVTQHESPERQAALAQRGNPEDWIILLTVTSKGDFQWGDAGDLFFVIHKSDLARQDFRKVFVTMESS